MGRCHHVGKVLRQAPVGNQLPAQFAVIDAEYRPFAIQQAGRRKIRPDFAERVQARGDGGIGRGHPRQRIGQRIGLRADRAGAAAVAVVFRDQRRPVCDVAAREAVQPGVERGFQFGREIG